MEFTFQSPLTSTPGETLRQTPPAEKECVTVFESPELLKTGLCVHTGFGNCSQIIKRESVRVNCPHYEITGEINDCSTQNQPGSDEVTVLHFQLNNYRLGEIL